MSLKIFNFLKKYKPVLLVVLVFALSFVLAPQALAGFSDWAGEVVGGIIYVFIWTLGLVLILVMKGLLLIATYQSFITSGAVIEGWVVVRDLANMFFVVILLIIAFATILHFEDYNYKKWLPKLILMAVLINFSKTICGLLIDVAQIVMLTFVNAFKDVAGGNLVDMLGIKSIVTIAKSDTTTGKSIGFWAIVGAYILGLIYMIVALVVITTMMMVLAMRIVMIWIYVVLSPLAYLLSAFPGGASYASDWWKEFIKNLVVGPVLAFFIWLSFAALQTGQYGDVSAVIGSGDTSTTEQENFANSISTPNKTGEVISTKPSMVTEASTPGVLIKFIIGIGMLIGGLKISQQIGGAAGSVAGKGMSKLSSMGTATVGYMGRSAVRAGGNVGMGIAKQTHLKEGLGAIASRTGVGGRILAATGIRGLATKSLMSLNSQQKKIEEKAGAKLENLNDTRVMARYANESSFTGTGAAMRKKARKKMPSAIRDQASMNESIAEMSREDLGKLSDSEWHALGSRGAHLGGRSMNFVQKDSDARGAYNLGMETAGVGRPLVVGTTQHGAPIVGDEAHGSYMRRHRAGTIARDEEETLARENTHAFDYFKQPPALEHDKTTKVSTEDQDKDRGQGNLSINKFASGQSTLAVDFDKLNLNDIEKGGAGDKDWRNVRGVNTSNPEAIKKIADSMLSLIDQEISALKAKPQLSGGEEKRLSSLSNAKNRLSDPESMGNLSLINSSASNFKTSDVKETMIHEEIHGLGYENEDDVRSATTNIMATKNYDARKDRASIDNIIGKDQVKTRPVDKIISDENKSESPVTFPEASASFDTSSLENKLSKFTDKLESAASNLKGIDVSIGKPDVKPTNFTRLFKGLRKALSSNSKDIRNLASASGGDKLETPLEFSIIAKNLPADSQIDTES